MKVEQPVVLPIARIIDESKDHKTFVFCHKLNAKPGQFVMVWIPRVNQNPFSVSYQDKDRFAITVLRTGPFTKRMFRLKEGGLVGIQGPYGSNFTPTGKRIVLVGGGCGTASLAFFADELLRRRKKFGFFIGTKSEEYLLYRRRFPKANFATDDGSFGHKGFVTALLEDSVNRNKVDSVYSCGPETMLKKVAEICNENNIFYQLSLERYMKCGFGVCGACCLDPVGLRVCTDGPVFDRKIIKQLSEFGNYKRDSTGKKVSL